MFAGCILTFSLSHTLSHTSIIIITICLCLHCCSLCESTMLDYQGPPPPRSPRSPITAALPLTKLRPGAAIALYEDSLVLSLSPAFTFRLARALCSRQKTETVYSEKSCLCCRNINQSGGKVEGNKARQILEVIKGFH